MLHQFLASGWALGFASITAIIGWVGVVLSLLRRNWGLMPLCLLIAAGSSLAVVSGHHPAFPPALSLVGWAVLLYAIGLQWWQFLSANLRPSPKGPKAEQPSA